MLSLAGGIEPEFKSQETEVVKQLESIIARVKSGDIRANGFVLVLNDNDAEEFTPSFHYFCRATLAIALMDITKHWLIDKISS